MAAARVILPACLGRLLRSEMERCIEEANLGTVDTMVAKRYFIDKWPQIEIAAELGWNRWTVYDHLKLIKKQIENAAERLGLINPT